MKTLYGLIVYQDRLELQRKMDELSSHVRFGGTLLEVIYYRYRTNKSVPW